MLPMNFLQERYGAIYNVLVGRMLTITEIKQALANIEVHCPDDLARTLSVMRKKGIIKGKLCPERGAWVWWVEE